MTAETHTMRNSLRRLKTFWIPASCHTATSAGTYCRNTGSSSRMFISNLRMKTALSELLSSAKGTSSWFRASINVIAPFIMFSYIVCLNLCSSSSSKCCKHKQWQFVNTGLTQFLRTVAALYYNLCNYNYTNMNVFKHMQQTSGDHKSFWQQAKSIKQNTKLHFDQNDISVTNAFSHKFLVCSFMFII